MAPGRTVPQPAPELPFDETRRASGVEIRLDHLDRHSHENSHTFYLAYEGPLPRARGKTVKTDITIGERIVMGAVYREVRRALRQAGVSG